jgi:protein SCO1/2
MRCGPFVLAASLLAACQEVEERRFELRGKVVDVDARGRTVTVDHEEVEGFMPGMTMPFPVKDDKVFGSLTPGDGLNAILVVRDRGTEREYWLQELVVSRSLPSAEGPSPAEATRIGELAPDTDLVNQDGRRFRLSDHRGKAVLVTFIYTRCPLVDFCPRMTRHFEALEELLRADPELYQRTQLLTLSFDPEFDTPETLKAYAVQMVQATDATFAHWEFATGNPESVRELASFLQLEYRAEKDEIVHNLRTALLAPDGTLKEIYRGNEWSPGEALNDVKSLLGPL